MQILILGDVHGCVRHAAAVMTAHSADLAIQVGDLGAYPSYAALPASDRAFVDAHPEQGDIFALLDHRLHLGGAAPVYFVTGNHDSSDWLDALHHGQAVVPIDPGRRFFHVACGSTVELAGRRFGFLGGIEDPSAGHDIELAAAARIRDVDVLVTHDGPFGLAEWRGRIQGSLKLRRVIEQMQPALHLHGHYHHRNGPRHYGRTTSFGLAQLVRPSAASVPVVAEGGVGLLDTDALTFEYISPFDGGSEVSESATLPAEGRSSIER